MLIYIKEKLAKTPAKYFSLHPYQKPIKETLRECNIVSKDSEKIRYTKKARQEEDGLTKFKILFDWQGVIRYGKTLENKGDHRGKL